MKRICILCFLSFVLFSMNAQNDVYATLDRLVDEAYKRGKDVNGMYRLETDGSEKIGINVAAPYLVEEKGFKEETYRFTKLDQHNEYAYYILFTANLNVIDENEKYGYIDNMGTVVIAPRFKHARDFSEGLAAVKDDKSDKYGYINMDGQYIITPQYDRAGEFHGRLACVRVGDLYGFIDQTGKFVVEPQFVDAEDFHEGLAMVAVGDLETGKRGYIDKKGNFVIELLAVTLDDLFDVLEYIETHEAFPSKEGVPFITGFDFSEGLAAVQDAETGLWGYISKDGKYVIAPQFGDDPQDFSEGLAAVEDAETGLLGYINKGGKYVIAPQFEDACGFSEGLARVFDFSSDRWGFVDKSGDFVIKPQFKSALDFSEGLVAVKFEDEHFGFINKNGSTVIKLPYLLPDIYCINNFHNGLAKINDKISGSIVYINKAGEVVYLHNYK